MDKKQASEIIKLISAAYPNLEFSQERIKLWIKHLEPIGFDLADRRVNEFIARSKFAPTIAEIINPEEPGKRKKVDYLEGSNPAAIINGGSKWMI